MIRLPRLISRTLPVVAVVVGAKAVLEATDAHPLDLNPLLSGLIAAVIFMLGFLLSGTIADYKESERLPGELACSLEAIADECLIAHLEKDEPEAHAALDHLERLGRSLRAWLTDDRDLESVLVEVRGLNVHFSALSTLIQPGYTTRMKGEQATMRRTLVRIDAIRNTSFVPAGYVIVEVVGALLLAGMLLTQESTSTWESLFFVGVITLLLTYVFLLIRDLDDPFGYAGGVRGETDVSLDPLDRAIARLVEDRESVATELIARDLADDTSA